MSKMSNIKKNDLVEIIAGKDKGKRGKVLEVLRKSEKVVVEGVNIAIKHQKPTMTNQEGGKIEKPMPIHISNVMPVDPKTDKTDRIRVKTLEDGFRVRFFKKTGETVD